MKWHNELGAQSPTIAALYRLVDCIKERGEKEIERERLGRSAQIQLTRHTWLGAGVHVICRRNRSKWHCLSVDLTRSLTIRHHLLTASSADSMLFAFFSVFTVPLVSPPYDSRISSSSSSSHSSKSNLPSFSFSSSYFFSWHSLFELLMLLLVPL